MSSVKKSLAYVTALAVAVGGLVVAGAPAASASSGPPQPYEEDDEGVSVPIFGLIAIAGIATIAIWQGINDAKKKKKTQLEKEEELQEQEEFEEYFEFEKPESEAGEAPAYDNDAEPAPAAASE
jgi:hypothetical protein